MRQRNSDDMGYPPANAFKDPPMSTTSTDRKPEPVEADASRRRIDAAMLQSLSTAFQMRANGYELMVSFNDNDIAELLRRAAVIVEPRVVPVLISVRCE